MPSQYETMEMAMPSQSGVTETGEPKMKYQWVTTYNQQNINDKLTSVGDKVVYELRDIGMEETMITIKDLTGKQVGCLAKTSQSPFVSGLRDGTLKMEGVIKEYGGVSLKHISISHTRTVVDITFKSDSSYTLEKIKECMEDPEWLFYGNNKEEELSEE